MWNINAPQYPLRDFPKICTVCTSFQDALGVLRLLPIGDTTKCRSPKNGKYWGFSPPQDDRINWSRWNFAVKHVPWVCYSTPNLALIGKRGSVQELPKLSKFAQNCGFWPPEADKMNTFSWSLACKCRPPWVCSSTPNLALIGKRESVQEPPKIQKLWFLATGIRHNEHNQIKFGV